MSLLPERSTRYHYTTETDNSIPKMGSDLTGALTAAREMCTWDQQICLEIILVHIIQHLTY